MSAVAKQGEIKRNIASLVGGIFVAIFVFVLWLLVLDSTGPVAVVSGLVIAAALGIWVRLADL
jgi:hypothetical protein